MIKHLQIAMLFGVLGISTALAGDDKMMYDSKLQEPVLYEQIEYFRANEFSIGVFGLATIAVETDDRINGGFGGGLDLTYFFTKYVGLSIQGHAWDSSEAVYGMSGSVILRYPIEEWHLAPYIFGGGGYDADPVEQGTAHGGLGFEYRFTPNIGWFTDGRYVFASEEYAMIRTGVRFAF